MIQIALLGCGTIAGGVTRLLEMNAADIEQKLGVGIKITRVLARTPKKARALGFKGEAITQNLDDILTDPDVQIVVELMGGVDAARYAVEAAICAGKQVVTANKDLIARHGTELYRLARQHQIDLYYEASVGGGIPIIMPMRRTLAANTITQMVGILNGTTNYMLSRMADAGMTYEEALKEAQALGYAERNPTADVDGLDAGRKIAILAKLAYHADITDEMVPCEGIRKLRKRDISIAASLGYAVKLLAVAKDHENSIELGVYPAFIPKHHPLAAVSDAFNALLIKGDAVGDVMLYGQGAGAMPTASSVVGDIMQIVRHIQCGGTGQGNDWAILEKTLLPPAEAVHSYYICMTVADRPNVLATIARAFGNHTVSIRSVSQNPTDRSRSELVLITHDVKASDLLSALADIRTLPDVDRIDSVIRVMNPLS